MPHFRAKPIEVEAHRWERNGDHPLDYAGDVYDPMGDLTYTAEYRREHDWEGALVRRFRHPEIAGWKKCQDCQYSYDSHGWIDIGEEGHRVCPGDWIITGIGGEYYPCKPGLFVLSYDLVNDPGPVLDLVDSGRMSTAEVLAELTGNSHG